MDARIRIDESENPKKSKGKRSKKSKKGKIDRNKS